MSNSDLAGSPHGVYGIHAGGQSESVSSTGHAADRQYLLLTGAGVHFALPILSVREILEPPAITRVPMAPEWFLGLANLRGQILPVIDLAYRLNISQKPKGTDASGTTPERMPFKRGPKGTDALGTAPEGMPSTPKEKAARPVLVVVDVHVRQGVLQRGLLIDTLGGIIDAGTEEIKAYDGVGSAISREYVTGLLPFPPNFAIILDLERVFASVSDVAASS